jgi:hypothetical protein
MWCSAMINVMFNKVKPLSTIPKRTTNKRWMQENERCRKVVYFKLFRENCMKIITTGQIFILNYELSRFLK